MCNVSRYEIELHFKLASTDIRGHLLASRPSAVVPSISTKTASQGRNHILQCSCILVLEVGGLFFLKKMTLAGFMKVIFFALNLTSERGGYSIPQESESKAEMAHTLWEKVEP